MAAAGVLAPAHATAATLYWDANDVTPGAGTTPNGTWGGTTPSSFWTSDSTGSIATGAYVSGSDVVFSAGTDATGSYTVTLGASQTAGSLSFEEGNIVLTGGPNLTLNGSGNVTVANGLTVSMNQVIPGASTGFIKLGGGTLNFGTGTTGSINPANVQIKEGTFKITRDTAGGTGSAIAGTATVTVDGGIYDTNGRNETVATMTLISGTVTNSDATNDPDLPSAGWAQAATYNLQSGVFNARMTGAGTMTKTTAGTVTVSKGNSFSGATNVNDGRLIVTGALASGAGIIQVNGPAVLAGAGVGTDGASAKGSVGRVSVNSGGTIAPGTTDDTTGLFLVRAGDTSGGFTLASGGTLDIELGGTTAGTGYDRLIVTGGNTAATTPVTLGGDLDVSFLGGFTPNVGDLFFILEQRLASAGTGSVNPINGTFTGLSDNSTFFVDNVEFRIRYTGDAGTGGLAGGDDVVLETIAVPEPTSLAAFGAAAAMVLARRRRRSSI
jgi:autotransporter-associated beta strand protein